MKNTTKFIGLDVSKEKIAVAIADVGREAPRYYGMIPHTAEAIRSLVKKLGQSEHLFVCYEAGPTGYPLYRLFKSIGVHCDVIAPSLIPQKPGDRVKTDKRDAVRLAQLYRAGELTTVHVPSEEDEALRDLTRCREDAKEDELSAKHRLTKFLLRHDIRPPDGINRWTHKYYEWLDALQFTLAASRIVFQEYYHQLKELQQRVRRLEEEIKEQAALSSQFALIKAFQALRGIALVTATSLVAEISSFKRFESPRQLMAYIGLIPSESSSGEKRYQGKITKAGNRHLRKLLIEAAWSYRHRPAVKGQLEKRQQGISPAVLDISWKAQNRLHKKYYRLLSKGKEKNKVVTAVARELAGFIWAVAQEIEPAHQ
ncbi:IS110 family RNA-guided transposase [Jeotgalibacillus terrae]|uniref:IS110 family transposase n=1 Tax=Jeotgalibacillus terrae TaxID=587735 RepID=A0ABW5ZM11_9BACL|nr:IS110 family transposase [Jeotgalibacillus terrae]MBM7581173.1 transposase [Jeotgalibacillus terrae]